MHYPEKDSLETFCRCQWQAIIRALYYSDRHINIATNPTTSHILANRNILLGVTGGIACYKSAELVRRLKDTGANVRVVMTAGAEAFVSALTFQAVSGNPVHTSLLDPEAEAGMGHIELAKWADRVLIAPASASFISRLAKGDGSDLLSTVCLATVAPILIAPAMNQAMWANPATQENVGTVSARGIEILGPGSGAQACGDIGAGRMTEPLELVEGVANSLNNGALAGKKVVVTAGPTREAIDPVRYISNRSSGKMGYAIAAAAATAGGQVVIVSGPVSLDSPAGTTVIPVTSAKEMHEAVMQEINQADIFIGAAAVADYRPVSIAAEKIKKSDDEMTIQLVKNPDILYDVSHLEDRPLTIGFAAESEKLIEHAKIKLERKKLDLIIANDISRSDSGFDKDTNEVVLISHDATEALPKADKTELAKTIVARIALLSNKT